MEILGMRWDRYPLRSYIIHLIQNKKIESYGKDILGMGSADLPWDRFGWDEIS